MAAGMYQDLGGMKCIVTRLVFWFRACALLTIGFATGPVTAGEIDFSDPAASLCVRGVVSSRLAILITFGAPLD